MTEVRISFGCMSDPIQEQLKAQGYTLSKAEAALMQDLTHALNMVQIHGLVPDSVCRTARQRLMKQITQHIKSIDLVENRKEE